MDGRYEFIEDINDQQKGNVVDVILNDSLSMDSLKYLNLTLSSSALFMKLSIKLFGDCKLFLVLSGRLGGISVILYHLQSKVAMVDVK